MASCLDRVSHKHPGRPAMAVYLLTYDLAGENGSADHDLLWDELRRRGAHRMLDSAWLLDSDADPQALLSDFKKLLNEENRLFVTALRRGEFTYTNARGGTNDWLEGSRLD